MNPFLLALPLGLILLVLAGCDPASSQQEQAAPQAPPPVAVATLKVERESIPLQYEYVGQIAGSLEVEIRNRITGIIEQRHFEEGGEVTAGQLLFSLDDAQYRAQLRQARAAIDSARAQKLTAQAQLKKAQRELKRVTPLANQQMLSQNQQDEAASAWLIAASATATWAVAISTAEAASSCWFWLSIC